MAKIQFVCRVRFGLQRVILGNFLPGIPYGLMFCRRSVALQMVLHALQDCRMQTALLTRPPDASRLICRAANPVGKMIDATTQAGHLVGKVSTNMSNIVQLGTSQITWRSLQRTPRVRRHSPGTNSSLLFLQRRMITIQPVEVERVDMAGSFVGSIFR